jgi:oxygen-dependent protoporphyrinogen oxidase
MAAVTVVGAGVAGLTAARVLAEAGLDVTVREASGQPGGKLRTTPLAGQPLDEGAESFLVRVPDGVELAAELGLALRHPVTEGAGVVVDGRLRALPTGTVLGVPTRLTGLTGVLGVTGVARAAADLVLPAGHRLDEPTVGELVRARMGDRVADRLVEPLLGGVYAGHADLLGVRAVAPALAGPGRSLLRTARAGRGTPRPGPVFGTVAGGMGGLVQALAATPRVQLRTGRPVRRLGRHGTGWLVDGEATEGVVLAVPAGSVARLLTDIIGDDAATETRYASVAVIALALSSPPPVSGSGFLVPPREGRMVKAVTLHSQKWGTGEPWLVRASVGRYGEQDDLGRSDGELAGVAAAELAQLTGWHGRVLASRVSRWDGALPQYLPGHGERVAALRAVLPPGLALAGAGFDGVGVPACIRSGRAAARLLLDLLMGD